MKIRFFPPHRLLTSHVAHIWTVESPTGYKPEDIKTIVPNGRMKIVFPYRGSLLNSADGRPFSRNPQNTLWALGMSDRPSIVDSDGPFGALSVEFHPGAAWPFYPHALKALANQVLPAPDVYGTPGTELQGRLAEEPTIEGKVNLVQRFLLRLLREADHPDAVVSHAVSLIRRRRGLLSVRELTEKLGYSQRYILMKFDRFVGLGPKTLAEVIRFQNRFVHLTRFGSPNGGAGVPDEDYYDQAHFTKEFKRFAGLPPGSYARASNEFLNLFYRSHESGPAADGGIVSRENVL